MRVESAEGIGGERVALQAGEGVGGPAPQSFESHGAAARSEIRPLDGQACQPGQMLSWGLGDRPGVEER